MKKLITGSIKSLIDEFKNCPDNFFSEADFQDQLFYILSRQDKLNIKIATKDGKKVKLVHSEYPSVNRIKLNHGKGYRVWFDVAILNPDFVSENPYDIVIARDEKRTKLWGENILCAIELKYFPKKTKASLQIVGGDCYKLSMCPEVKEKFVLVFSKFALRGSELKQIKVYDINLIWTGLEN